jgi:hypothetical protein
MKRISRTTGALAVAAALAVSVPAGSAVAGSNVNTLRHGADDVCKNKPTKKLRHRCHLKHEGVNHQ